MTQEYTIFSGPQREPVGTEDYGSETPLHPKTVGLKPSCVCKSDIVILSVS